MKLPGSIKTGVRGLAAMPSIAAYESQKAQSLQLSIAAIDSSQLTEIEKQEKKRMVRNDIGYIKITSIADADPDKALKMLQEPSYIKSMPPQKLLQLTQYC